MQALSLLPQYGFSSPDNVDFDDLIKSNQFLFRVYTPKESMSSSEDAYFIAPRFNDQIARSPIDLPNIKFPETIVGTYAEVARHMEWTTKSSSCYISASFSFAWAIWEAVKRFHVGVKKDVHIAVIDASKLGGRAATAVQLLMKSPPAERDETFDKWHRFASDSQTVLIYGIVPSNAVLSSIPLLHLLRKLPSYFIRNTNTTSTNPLDLLAWNYTKRHVSYRHFCSHLSSLFLSLSEHLKLRDSTVGAVKLSLTFLRPFVLRAIQRQDDDDLEIAISHLRSLALCIAQWPSSDGWAIKETDHHHHHHDEIRTIVGEMVRSLVEEMKERHQQCGRVSKDKENREEEVKRLKLVIKGLEKSIIKDKEVHPISTTVIVDDILDDGDSDEDEFGVDDPTLVATIDPPKEEDRPLLQQDKLQQHHLSQDQDPRSPRTLVQTPITPPESPRNSIFIPNSTTNSVVVVMPMPPVPMKEGGVLTIREEDLMVVSPPLTPPTAMTMRSLDEVEEGIDREFGLDDLPEEEEEGEAEKRGEDEHDEESLEKSIEQTLENEVLGFAQPAPLADDQPHSDLDVDNNADEANNDVDDDDDEKTEPGDDYDPDSILSSPRSSIFSIETLCEPSSPPSNNANRKRLSSNGSSYYNPSSRTHSRTNSFDFFTFKGMRPLSPLRLGGGKVSRTVSFSEPLIKPGFPFPSLFNNEKEEEREKPPSMMTTFDDPLVVPLPPSPVISDSEKRDSKSPSPSPSPSLDDELSHQIPVSPLRPPPLSESSSPLILLPKRRISLLSPLSPQTDDDDDVYDDDDDDDDDEALSVITRVRNEKRRGRRTTETVETASYIVTGFLVGAFLTLFLFSTQRRTLLYVT